ncbi:PLP-dependent aminotransferase family protein [Alloyangia pacifica]|uniref:DNA-binding transcriptional regulator, MocR family, contains an aminotransferase domain n=1 Tax=Alloyangia pacifica TaxID=311180 RepID=A0A1I6W8B6_9RHOB|nr:PLP-dependent aminotransferase family protein [Alloyangia pacifica]SDI43576.1 DNA-binding transcriptional regulator, MocR family, contains an aminotransferase domain [Alloyangia pacifica]SFT22180.1 DNA-binding transcriptional regulator, MocR family, contains an aminotransferase domain [Alloyangia pacifica]
MSHWPLIPEDITRPAYRSVAQGIVAAIGDGALRPGDRLPAHRELAWQLGISVQTVSRAYEELIRADMVSGEVGRGTFVKSGPRETVEIPWHRKRESRPRLDLSLMSPVQLPQIADAWRCSMQRIAQKLPHETMFGLRPGETLARYGAAASDWLARCGLIARPARVLVANGVTPAMFVALMTVARHGDVIATEAATSHTLKPAARQLGLRLQGIAHDARGMLPEALAEAAAAASGQMKAVYLLPSGAGPYAQVMDSDRRAALAQVAEAAGLFVLECDPLGPLVTRRPPPVASFAPNRSFYFTGLTKCLSPGLRFGILAMPDHLAERTVNRHLSVSWMATPIIAEIAADWMESGVADTILQAHRKELAARNRMAQRLLGPGSAGFAHGLHRWLPLPEGIAERAFQRQALRNGVAVAAGANFAVTDRRPAIRVCLGGLGRGELEQALGILASLLPAPGQPTG